MSSDEFRSHFPMLADVTHLASCSQGARSAEVDAALQNMLESISEQGAPWGTWIDEVERARAQFAALIHASPDEVAVMPNASTGAHQVGSVLAYARRSGIISTEMEFPSIGQVWRAQERRGASVRYAGERSGMVTIDSYRALIDDTTAMVSVPLVSYKNGAVLPVSEVAECAKAHGARVFVDAYQGAGVMPIDVGALGCDYLVAGNLKYLLGLPGIAFLYVRAGVVDEIPPSLTGWFGRPNPFDFDPRGIAFPDEARRLESGTPAIPAAYAANAGMGLLLDLDLTEVRRHVHELVTMTARRLGDLGATLYWPELDSARGPQVAIRVPDPLKLGDFLRGRRIFTSPRGDVVRLSFHYYNTVADVDACVAAMKEYGEF